MTSLRIVLAGSGFAAARAYLHKVSSGISLEALDPATLRERGCEATVLIPMMSRIDGTLMDQVQGLRLIQQWGAGLEGVDIEAASQRGIAVANVPTAGTGNAESVAEWCVMAAIAISRRLPELAAGIRNGSTWGGPIGRSLLGKTAGIVGLGGIGQALATRLRPFGMRLIGLKRRPDPALADELGMAWIGSLKELPRLLEQSDLLFLCLPLSDQTRGLIDANALAQLPENARIINVGRGGLLSQTALIQALSEGRLAGAALDVFEEEPVDPSSPLLARQDVLATPHIGGVTDVAYKGIAQTVADNLHRLQTGQPLQNCVNRKALGGAA